jgi:acyl carrier protein
MTLETGTVISPAAGSTPLDEQQSIARFISVVGEVIGVDNISAGDHFLDVGGDSLSAAILIDWISQEFGVEPELDWFFDSQTVEELAGKWWGKVQAQRATVPAGE